MSDQQSGKAFLGTWIKVRGVTPKNESFEDAFHLVSDEAADRAKHNVAMSSLLGQGLNGAKAGDEVVLETLEGPMRLTVLKLGRTYADIA